jgi:CRP/FNR family transcriptional regulator, anaerobic regulatory protein
MENYINQFKEYCKKYIDFLPEEFDFYEQTVDFVDIKKKDFLLKSGEVENYMYYVIEGVFRHFLVKDGKEICTEFVFPDTLMSSFISFGAKKPSMINIQALADAKVMRISKDNVDKFNDFSKNSERFSRQTMEILYTQKALREISLISTTAEERYLRLLQKQPKIEKIIAVKDIATYLGIHPESLSRIRKKVHRS